MQITKLKSGIKDGTELTLNLSINVIGDSNDKTNFPHKLLFTDKQVWRLWKAFANDSTNNKDYFKPKKALSITLTKNQIEHDIKVIKLINSQEEINRPEGGFLGNFPTPLIKFDLIFKKCIHTLAKNELKLLRLTTTTSGTVEAISKKIYGLGITKLIISIKEMKDTIKIVKYLEESGLLTKGVSETIEIESKE